MRVTDVLEHWLEDELRRRRWMRVADAAARLRARAAARSFTGVEGIVGRTHDGHQ